jgi:cytochrome c oxidase cbb3-type subunit III
MSAGWHWFVVLGTLLSLAFMGWLLFANRHKSNKGTTGHTWDGIEELDNPLPMWWVGMFVVSIIFMLLYVAYYGGLGNWGGGGNWSSTAQHDAEVAQHEARFAPLYAELGSMSEEDLQNDRRAMQVGRRLYLNNCSTCHGVNANGAFGFPNLTDEEWQWGGDYQAIKTTLVGGRVAAMPPWGPALGEDGVVNMTNYVLMLSGQDHDADKAAAAKPQYDMLCVACHGVEGKGNAIFGSPDLTNDIWLYGGSAEQINFTLTHGRNGNMPAQSDILSEDKIHILSAYIRSLSQ